MMSQTELKNLMDSLHIPEDEKLDAIALNGSWYIKTNAGNLDTARTELKKFRKFNDVIIENDYIQCVSCCESIVWGTNTVHYLDVFYHEQCWSGYCKGYYQEVQ